MRNTTAGMLVAVLLSLPWPSMAVNGELHLGRFGNGDMSGWKEQTIGLLKPKTTYTITRIDDRMALAAYARKTASGMIYRQSIDPKKHPVLAWSWKIGQTIRKGDEKVKEGDDFAARVYVLFPRGFFSKTRAICYVWANRLPKGSHIPSPFTSNVVTVAIDSGDERAGTWISHQRNVYEDYRTFFGEEPPTIGAVALMTDTDNTGEFATAYYGDISMLPSAKSSTRENGGFARYSSAMPPAAAH